MLKCIVWDLDNTILDGVLIEDSSVKLRDGIKDILELIHEKKVLQTIVSKNDKNQALSRLKDLDIIDYFIYPQINWNPKSKSIKRIIDNLHFKAEDVLFLDDQLYELDEVQNTYEDVKTFPSGNLTDMKEYIMVLLAELNPNTIDRIDLYRLEEKRLMDRERYFVTNKDFLLSCQMQVSISRARYNHIERIRELITRTNQLNLNKRDYSDNDLKWMIDSEQYGVLLADVKDRYGSYDVSGVLILNYTEGFIVELLIVSCRLLGKGVANALLDYGVQLAIRGQHNRIYVKYKKTPYNRPFLYLLLQCGFKKQEDSMFDPNFYLDLRPDSRLLPDWITIVHSEDKEVL
nr:HAD-IIIC family phosphatase [Paenibacillus piscarius]